MCSLFVALLLLPFFTMQCCVAHSIDFHVGVVLDLDLMDSPVGRIGMSYLSMALSDFYSFHVDYKTRLVLHPVDSNGSVVDAAAAALHLLRDVKVDAIIGPQKSTQVNFVMDLGDRAHVPIISFSATSPSLIHQTPYFVRTAQSDANQVQAIASIIKVFQWTQVVIIYEDTEFGNGIIPYLSNALQDVNARVPYRSVLPRSTNDDFISNELHKMMGMQTRVFVVHMSQALGTRFFLKARELGMMAEGYVWIVTSGLTDLFSSTGSDVAEAMQGVLGVRPLIPKSEELHSFASRWRMFVQDNHDTKLAETSIFGLWAYDTLWALGMAAERVGRSRSSATENENNVNLTNPFTSLVSETGPELLKVLLDTRFRGLAGEFSLVKGQLGQTTYEIVNVVESIERPVGTWRSSGGISGKQNSLNGTISSSTSKESFRSIIWPGDSTKPPRGWGVGERLRIAMPLKPGFNDYLKVERQVFDAVMKALPYALPYEFVSYNFNNPDGSKGSYDELVYQVSLQKDYDGALGDITITANRSNHADFTMPYAEGGVACIVPTKYEDVNDVFTFLQPLTIQLWVTTVVLYISTAVVTWILAKRLVHSSRDSLAQHAGMACLFPFFPGLGIEISLICVILVTWAFVANLLNSTYTASLSSRLTIARLLPTVTNVEELMANRDNVGFQDGSFVESYLMNLGFNKSRIIGYTTEHDCKTALSNKNISAYCDVLPHIKAILSEACGKFMMIEPIYRTDGFGFAFPKGFPAAADISKAILELIENGTILDIEKRHISTSKCLGPDTSSSPTRVSLRSFSVLFAITGFVTLACLVASLLIHLHSRRSLRQRIADFNANSCSRILSFRHYLKRNQLSSLSTTADTRENTPHVEEIGSSNDHIIEIGVIALDHNR
ncbi:hypothetical protein C2S53_002419 [Perilla frutescens var. hirtella]|uniref:Glutamate receptor n=1 Tax=Perilla frutescens var. hirtella TaxID=608512 RepID=A0AAD4IPM0_PERFH|nr:hypothetical protein C2S53_002419 [Perilla frutescens var. hirtella]